MSVTDKQYRKAISEMRDQFDALPSLQGKGRHARMIEIVYAWAAQVHRFARAIVVLVDAGYEHEAMVLVRSMLEYTITLHWLVEAGDRGIEAVMRRHQQSLQNVKASAAKGIGMLLPDEAIDSVLDIDILKVDEEDTLRRFEQICSELGIDFNLYVVYRVMSTRVHPTFSAVAEYVDVDEDTGDVRTLLVNPVSTRKLKGGIAWTAYCLVWTGRALDKLLTGRPLRRDLQRIARDIGTVRLLPERARPTKKKSPAKKAAAKKRR